MIVSYLINRPIAVTAIFLSVLAVGIYGWVKIPVNLLPDVDPPEIVIEVRKNGISAEVMERTVLGKVRQSVIGSLGLQDVESKALQGYGRVSLSYEFGTDIDLSLIEVNEKIDRVVSSLPPEMDRPIVKKKKPTDIPLIFIHVASDHFDISKLSPIVQFELTKRFEQLKGVAQIEVNGAVKKSIRLTPKMDKIIAAGLDLNQLNSLIARSNLPIGQVLVKDGNYEYLIQIENILQNKASLEKLTVSTPNGQQIALAELLSIEDSFLNPLNRHVFDNKTGIVIAIYNQPEANLFDLHTDIDKVLDQLQAEFPNIKFATSQDQVSLLRDNINQLYSTSALAVFFAFLVFFISGRSRRLPLILGTVIPSSLLIAIGLLWLLGLTLNIITLSGFILGIGLLVDNVIILIEEINQNRSQGLTVKEACIVSVKNIFPALLSSTLTTICVFIPLLALDGIASELFKEQAISLIIILGVSLVLTFILVPTYYTQWIHKEVKDLSWVVRVRELSHNSSVIAKISVVILLIGLGWVSIVQLKTEDLPSYTTADFQAKIVWNESVSLDENYSRLQTILPNQKDCFVSANLGVSDITQHDVNFFDEVNLYLSTSADGNVNSFKKTLKEKVKSLYPNALLIFSKAANTFEMIFYNDQPPAEARIRKVDGTLFSSVDLRHLSQVAKNGQLQLEFNKTYRIRLLNERIENSSISYTSIVDHLKNLSDENVITSLKRPDQNIPILVSMDDFTYFFQNDSSYLDLSAFYELKDTTEVRTISADLSGPFVSCVTDNIEDAKAFGENATKHPGLIYNLNGELFDNVKIVSQLILAGLLGVILLYLILVAQFESFTQPLIIFSLVPLTLMGSFIGLHLSGSTLNIMSIIGMVVMLGIIVNDSILKVDAINRNVRAGMSKIEAITKAKNERFKPILMTSLSTILALIPVLLSSGIASDLQKPLAIVVISGLVVGTWSSISLLPWIYSKIKVGTPA